MAIKKIGFFTKFILFILFMLACAIFGVYLFFGQGGDIPLPQDAHLLPSHRHIEENINGYHYFTKAAKQFIEYFEIKLEEFPTKEIVGKIQKDLEETNAWSKNEKAISILIKGLSCKDFVFPYENLTLYFPLDNIWKLRKISDLLRAKSLVLSKEGKHVQAIEMVLKSIELGYRIENLSRTIICLVTGSLIKKKSCETLQYIIMQSNISFEITQKYISKLEVYANNSPSSIVNSLKGEYLIIKNFIANVASQKIKENTEKTNNLQLIFFFQPNRTIEMLMRRYECIVLSAAKPYQQLQKTLDENSRLLQINRKSQPLRNRVGHTLIAIAVPQFLQSIHMSYEADLMVKCSQIIFALEAYRKQNGKTVNSLQQLVPQYFSKIPIDNFNGQNIKYDAELKELILGNEKRPRIEVYKRCPIK